MPPAHQGQHYNCQSTYGALRWFILRTHKNKNIWIMSGSYVKQYRVRGLFSEPQNPPWNRSNLKAIISAMRWLRWSLTSRRAKIKSSVGNLWTLVACACAIHLYATWLYKIYCVLSCVCTTQIWGTHFSNGLRPSPISQFRPAADSYTLDYLLLFYILRRQTKNCSWALLSCLWYSHNDRIPFHVCLISPALSSKCEIFNPLLATKTIGCCWHWLEEFTYYLAYFRLALKGNHNGADKHRGR